MRIWHPNNIMMLTKYNERYSVVEAQNANAIGTKHSIKPSAYTLFFICLKNCVFHPFSQKHSADKLAMTMTE